MGKLECLALNDSTDLSISETLWNFLGDTGVNFPGMTEWDVQAQYVKDNIKC